jgi:hypothetical protein
MNDPIVRSFAAQLAGLEQFIASQWAWPTPEAGFAWHVFHAAGELGPGPAIATASWPDTSAIRHAPTLAAYGYWFALTTDVGSQHHEHWAHVLEHLTVKDPFPLDRQSFTFRPMDLFGIVLGVTRCNAVDRETRSRLTQILGRLGAEGNKDLWSTSLYGLVAYVLGVHWNKPVAPSFDGMLVHVLALLKWMTVAYSSSPNSLAIVHHVDDLDRTFLERCGLGRLETDDIGRAALVYFALRRTVAERIRAMLRDTWPANRETQDAAIIVEHLCRRFPLYARQLQHRRQDVPASGKKETDRRPTIEMKDEYDVQDSLHALLKLHFDDVRPEEWTPSYAGSQSRMDFLLKREKIVVETKFMGPKLSQREVTNQLMIDKDYYRQHPDCQRLICFVYDPECRCTNPAALERDIGVNEERFRVTVIVSPKGT